MCNSEHASVSVRQFIYQYTCMLLHVCVCVCVCVCVTLDDHRRQTLRGWWAFPYVWIEVLYSQRDVTKKKRERARNRGRLNNRESLIRSPDVCSLYLALPRSTSLYLVVPHSTSLYLALPHSTLLYLALPRSTSLYLALPRPTLFYLTLPRSTSLYLALPCPTSLSADWLCVPASTEP